MLASCKDNVEPDEIEYEPIEIEDTVKITLEPGKWIYYDISDKKIVGKSDIGDDEQDAEWGAQTDWDIAFCESGIRTNGGTSGRGQGGLTKINDSIYNLQHESSINALKYSPDVTGVSVIKPLEE